MIIHRHKSLADTEKRGWRQVWWTITSDDGSHTYDINEAVYDPTEQAAPFVVFRQTPQPLGRLLDDVHTIVGVPRPSLEDAIDWAMDDCGEGW